MSVTAGLRRRFLGMAFYPNGAVVSNMLELTGMSPDVAEAERQDLEGEHERAWSNDNFIDGIMQLAEVYEEGYTQAVAQGTIVERTPQEHLVAFLVSVTATLGVVTSG